MASQRKDEAERMRKIEDLVGVPIKDPELRRALLTHSSARGAGADTDNSRLAFLGDAVLSLAVAHDKFRKNPPLPIGDLTRERAEEVKNEALETLAKKKGLGLDMLDGNLSDKAKKARATFIEAIIGAIFVETGYDYQKAKTAVNRLFSEAKR